jgi:hypothetical protein
MNRLTSVIAMLVAIAIVVITVGGLVYGVIEDPAVVGPLAAAAVVIGVAIFQRRSEKSQELERAHRAEMTPIYEELIEMAKSMEKFSEKSEEEQIAFFKDTSTKLTLHGSAPVLRSWIAWNRALGQQPLSIPLSRQEAMMLAIREDLGLSNGALKRGDLVRLFFLEEDTDESREIWGELRSGQQPGAHLDL